MTTKLDLKKTVEKIERFCKNCDGYDKEYKCCFKIENPCFKNLLDIKNTIALQEIAEVLKPKEKEDSIPTLIEIANRYEDLKHIHFPNFYLLSKEEQEKIDKKTMKYVKKEVEYWDKKAKEQEGDR